jgi:hypothetical protein
LVCPKASWLKVAHQGQMLSTITSMTATGMTITATI